MRVHVCIKMHTFVRSRYAGIYIPTLMQEIARQGLITNVEGAAIGNGCCERAHTVCVCVCVCVCV